MSIVRKQFDASYKQQAAKMVLEQHLSITQICRDQGVSESAVRRWG